MKKQKRNHRFLPVAVREDMGTMELIRDCARLMGELRPGERYPACKVVHMALNGFKKHLEKLKAGEK